MNFDPNWLIIAATATATTAAVTADDDTVTITHYNDVIMGATASQITSLTIVYSTVYSAYSGADQLKHQSSASLAFVRGIHRWPVNSTHKWPVTRKMFPFDDVIMHHHNYDHFHYFSTCGNIDFPSYLPCRK